MGSIDLLSDVKSVFSGAGIPKHAVNTLDPFQKEQKGKMKDFGLFERLMLHQFINICTDNGKMKIFYQVSVSVS